MKNIFSLLLLFLLLICNNKIYAQYNNEVFSGCGSDILLHNNPDLLEYQKTLDINAYKYILGTKKSQFKSLTTYTIPVVVHIIHQNGSENISDVQVQNAIANFNTIYAQSSGDQIQFCLAQRDPNGNATNGITRDVSSLTTETMEYDDITLKNIVRWPPTCYLNIWVIKEILSSSMGPSVVGYARFPSSHGAIDDGLVIEANYFGANLQYDAIGAHEIGHYFGLYHTFQGGCSNSNCLQEGDNVCDTPPDQTTFASCVPPTNSCSTDADDKTVWNPYNSDVSDNSENYMDYSSINCYNNFTGEQNFRMNYFLTNVRSSLLNCKSCLSPCPNPTITANITNPGSATNILTGASVNFTGTAANSSSYEWYINPNTILSNGLSFNYTFSNKGNYWMKFKALAGSNTTCNDGIDSVLIFVTEPVVSSCAGSLQLSVKNSTILLPSNIENTNPTGFTWECWFKLNSDNTPNQIARIFINASDMTPGEDLSFGIGWSNPATLESLVFNVDPPSNSGSTVNYAVSYKPPGGFVKDVWYHGAGVMDYNKKVSKLYLNGQLVDTLNQPSFQPLISNTRAADRWPAPVSLGWDEAIGGNVPAPNANLDEVRIWKTVRTAAEILANYNQCLTGNEANLLTYYRFNQTAGSVATDATPNHNDGPLTNGAAWSSNEPAYTSTSCTAGCIEICNNGIDDNNNGSIDEGCPCPQIAISKDTTICKGASVNLTATGLSTYSWLPSAGLNVTTGTTVIATPTVTTTYTVVGTRTVSGTELVVNSDFSLGNTGFTNDYVFSSTGSPGNYSVGVNPISSAPDPTIPDHTPTTDEMRAWFDGSTVISTLWEQTINSISKNENYYFSFWATRVDVNLPQFEVHFIGDITGDVIVSSENGKPWTGHWPIWDEYGSIIWNSQSNNNLTIKIKNLQTNGMGDDFMIDDISLKQIQICKDTAYVKINVTNASNTTLNLGNDTSICVSGTHIFDAGPGFKEYLWQDGSTDQTFTAFKPGKYWVFVKSYCNNIIKSDTVSINLSPTPTLQLGNDTSLCTGDSLQLNFSSNGIFTTYQWTPSIGLSCTHCATPIAKPLVDTKYYLLASTINGCTNIDSISIAHNSSTLTLNLGNDTTLCDSIAQTIDAGAGFKEYKWKGGSANQTFIAVDSGKYWVTVKNMCDLQTQSDTISIMYSTKSVLKLGNDSIICSGETIQLNDTTKNSKFSNYEWSPTAGLSCSYCPSPAAKPKKNTEYHLLARTADGCIKMDTIYIGIKSQTSNDPSSKIPNIFSPNNDGLNDVFHISAIEIANCKIYNRWGKLVFEFSPPHAGWNGKNSKGEDCEEGVYYYLMTAKDECGKDFNTKGFIQLIR